MVSANSQFATVQCVSLSFSVFLSQLLTDFDDVSHTTSFHPWGSVNIAFHFGRSTNICRPKLSFTTGIIRVFKPNV